MRIGVVIPTKLREQLFATEDIARLDALGEVIWTDSPTHLTTAQAIALLQGCEVGVGSLSTPSPNTELVAAILRLSFSMATVTTWVTLGEAPLSR